MTKESLQKFEYELKDLSSKLDRLEKELVQQLNEIIKSNKVTLGFPVQSRVKKFESIHNKIENGRFNVKKSITELQDLVGIRIILLFNKDVDTICQLLRDNLKIIKEYNTGDKLEDNQFGYSSQHFIIKLPDEWLNVPTLKDLDFCTVEIQIRTVSQHIWAEASNTLQYKQEENIPREIKRSFSRVSALLETVDLEFERLLNDREKYYLNPLEDYKDDELLNVDLLAKILDNKFPIANKESESEEYSELLTELVNFGITNVGSLNEFIDENIDYALESDKKAVENNKEIESIYLENKEKLDNGAYFTHTGLVRTIMFKVFGDDYFEETFNI